MTRMEEYRALTEALKQTPPALEYTLTRAQARRRARRFSVPAASLLGALTAFALAINLSPPFALAVGHVPILGELAQLLAFSPSLSAAVEHDYVQPVGLELTENEITLRVDSLIADEKQLNLFYSLSFPHAQFIDAQWDVLSAEGEDTLTGFGIVQWSDGESDGLRCIVVDFSGEATLPQALTLRCTVRPWDSEGESLKEPLAVFTFPLTIDPAYLKNGTVYELNQSITLNGQTVTVTTAEVYPTHLRLNLADHPDNTAWLVGLDFHLTDGEGRRFDPVSNGISASGSPDTPFLTGYRVESPWFAGADRLSLVITGAKWLDKDAARVEVNLTAPAAGGLPEGVALASAVRTGNLWTLDFIAPQTRGDFIAQLFDSTCYAPDGTAYQFDGYGSGLRNGVWDEETQTWTEYEEPVLHQTWHLKDYPYDTVFLCPAFSRHIALKQPVTLRIN